MLYTRKGDNGTTKTFGCDQRISKSSNIAEALGALDEINSFLGLCKVKAKKPARPRQLTHESEGGLAHDSSGAGGEKFKIPDGTSFEEVVHNVQKNLFIIQAEVAGSPNKTISEEKVREIEKIIDSIEKELSPIKSFFISGGSKLAAYFDIARTIARRAERRVVGMSEPTFAEASAGEGKKAEIGEFTKAYLNRLSSLLYALARFSNHLYGITEESPDYK